MAKLAALAKPLLDIVKFNSSLSCLLQYSGFQQSADKCNACGHLIMDMVSGGSAASGVCVCVSGWEREVESEDLCGRTCLPHLHCWHTSHLVWSSTSICMLSAANCVYVFLCTVHVCASNLAANTITQCHSELHPVINLVLCFSLFCCSRSSKPWGSPTTRAASAVSSVTRALTECPSPWTRKIRSTASKITTGEDHLLQCVSRTPHSFCAAVV